MVIKSLKLRHNKSFAALWRIYTQKGRVSSNSCNGVSPVHPKPLTKLNLIYLTNMPESLLFRAIEIQNAWNDFGGENVNRNRSQLNDFEVV